LSFDWIDANNVRELMHNIANLCKLTQHAVERRGDIDIRFVGFKLEHRLAGVDDLTVIAIPFHELGMTFGHIAVGSPQRFSEGCTSTQNQAFFAASMNNSVTAMG
jgi:hypothetical protein